MKHKMRGVLFVILFTASLMATIGCASQKERLETKTPEVHREERGMFEWTEETLENPESTKDLVEALNITRWYQELPEDFDDGQLSAFISYMSGLNVKVYALAGSVEWGYESDGDSLIQVLKDLAEYNESVDETCRIEGIMADIEPYTSRKWEKDKEKHMGNYVMGMTKAYEYAQLNGLKMAVCIPRHYDDQGLESQLESLIAYACDEVAVMDYDCGNEVEKIETEAAYALKYGKELHCILEFQEVGKHGLVEEKTYRNKGIEAAWAAWKEVEDAYSQMDLVWDYHWTKPVGEMLKE